MFFGLFNKPDLTDEVINVFVDLCNKFDLDGRLLNHGELAVVAPNGSVRHFKINVEYFETMYKDAPLEEIDIALTQEIVSKLSLIGDSYKDREDFLYFSNMSVQLADYLVILTSRR